MSSTEHTPRDEIESLRKEVAELKEQVQNKQPRSWSRREALGLGAAGLLGGGLLGSGTAAAQNGNGTGSIGTEDNPLAEVWVDDLYQKTDNAVFDSVQAEESRVTGSEDIRINVPSDVSTFADAVEIATQYQPPANAGRVIVNIESGHHIATAARVRHGDYSHIIIRSDDDVVIVSDSLPEGSSLIFGENVRTLVIDCLIDMQGNGGTAVGYSDSSGLVATEGSGVINSGGTGLQVARGSYSARNSNFTGAGDQGLWASDSVLLQVQSADFSDAEGRGAEISRGSIINGRLADFSGAGEEGVNVRRSFAVVEESNLSGCDSIALNASVGSWISALNTDFSGCASNAISLQHGCFAVVSNSNFDDTNGARVRRSRLIMEGCSVNIDGTDSAIRVDQDGLVSADGCSFQNPDGHVLQSFGFGRVDLKDSDISNIGNDAIQMFHGTTVCASNVSVDGEPIEPSDTNVDSFNNVSQNGIIFG